MAPTKRLAEMGFWDHVAALRVVVLRIALVLGVAAVGCFIAMPRIFDSVILAPCRADFCFYRLLDAVAAATGASEVATDAAFEVHLINIELASQLFIHMSTSFWLALVIAFPVVVSMAWGFVAPGLYPREKRGIKRAFVAGMAMFYLGVACGYFVVFPLTLRFLAEYQVSAMVPNTITLQSYMDNFLAMIFVMGLVFELPMVSWLLGRMGVLTRRFFSRFRRHAIVVLLICAALITPTGDPFTLMVVFMPIYLLWEAGAWLVPKGEIATENTTENQ